MAISGTLEGMPPQDLLQWISRGKKHGILSVRCKDTGIDIRFRDGWVVGVHSSRSKDRLGALLVRKGIIDAGQLSDLRRDQSTRSSLMGEMLVQREMISENELEDVLVDQVQDILFDFLLRDSGEFIFEERQLDRREQLIEPVNTSTLLLEGTRRIDEWRRIRSEIPSNRVVFKRGFSEVFRPGLEEQIWNYLSKPRIVSDIVDEMNAPEFIILDTLRRMMNTKLISRDYDSENRLENLEAEIAKNLDRAATLTTHQGYHEALSYLNRAQDLDPKNQSIKRMICDIKIKILNDAKRMIPAGKAVPKIRQSFSTLAPERLILTAEEAFVFSRIDGTTDVRSLTYLTNLSKDDLHIILHKFIRMGLIYLDAVKPKNLSKRRH
ncbi:DUF4388 domain-containing protein [bacterium]|nr:DUF4388 domain-containing protein [candidate division CSSED10-310 bacterium]